MVVAAVQPEKIRIVQKRWQTANLVIDMIRAVYRVFVALHHNFHSLAMVSVSLWIFYLNNSSVCEHFCLRALTQLKQKLKNILLFRIKYSMSVLKLKATNKKKKKPNQQNSRTSKKKSAYTNFWSTQRERAHSCMQQFVWNECHNFCQTDEYESCRNGKYSNEFHVSHEMTYMTLPFFFFFV